MTTAVRELEEEEEEVHDDDDDDDRDDADEEEDHLKGLQLSPSRPPVDRGSSVTECMTE